MNRRTLKKALLDHNIPQDAYSLAGGFPNEAYCIERHDDKWHVYYSERGRKNTIGIFSTENDACKCLLSELLKIVH